MRFFQNLFILIKSHKIYIFICCFCLLPFLFLAAFNHPSADDFTIVFTLNSNGIIQSQIDWYLNWSGRYASSAIIGFSHPLLFHSLELYRVYPILLFLFSWWSASYLIASLIPSVTKSLKWAISGAMLLNYIRLLPSMVEGYYWLPGSFIYMLANIFTLVFISLLLRYETKRKSHLLLGAVIFAILSVGSNELNLLMINAITAFWLLNALLNKQTNIQSRLLVFVSVIAFSCLSLFAPGNGKRASVIESSLGIPTHDFGGALTASFSHSIDNIIGWTVYSPLLLLSFICFFFCRRYIDHFALKIHPIIIWFVLICTLTTLYFPYYYGTGNAEIAFFPKRALNVICFFYCFSFPLAFLSTAAWLIKRYPEIGALKENHAPKLTHLALSLFVFALFYKGNIIQAFIDVRSRNFIAYHEGLNKRYQEIEQSSSDTVTVDSIRFFPRTIYFGDITANPNDWKNAPYANYFNKKMIILKSSN